MGFIFFLFLHVILNMVHSAELIDMPPHVFLRGSRPRLYSHEMLRSRDVKKFEKYVMHAMYFVDKPVNAKNKTPAHQ